MKRIPVLIMTLILLSSCSVLPANTALNRYSSDIYGAFDTVITFTAYCENREQYEKLYTEVSDEFLQMHRLFDRYNTYPELNNLKTINDNAGKIPVEVDKRLAKLLSYACEVYKKTGGKVNVLLGDVLEMWRNARENNLPPPTEKELKVCAENADITNLAVNVDRSVVFLASDECSIDVGAIAKGFAVDSVKEKLKKEKVSSFLISCGSSSIYAHGNPTDKDAWSVGIRKPYYSSDEQEIIKTVDITDASVGTSGDYQNYYSYNGKKYHHLIDPETLYPAEYYSAVTVVCESCADCDALSTAIFLSSEEEGNLIADKFAANVIRIDKNLNVTEYEGKQNDEQL